MLRTLRVRFILSHTLPLLLVVPLMGIALMYVLETQVVLVNLAHELTQQAKLVADAASEYTGIWHDPLQAQAFVAMMDTRLAARTSVLDRRGYVIATNDLSTAELLGQPLSHPDWVKILNGEVTSHTTYGFDLQTEVVEVMVPVMRADQQVGGVVRLTHRLAGVSEHFLRVRYLIAGVLAAGLLVGALLGWLLALDLARPLRWVTAAVVQMALGERTSQLPERGPEEMRSLSHSVNVLVTRLRDLEQARQQLLANLVHELGRPLGAIGSAIRALQHGADQDAALRQELLVGIDTELAQLQRALDDLTRLHEHVVGPLPLKRQATPLAEWLHDRLVSWREAALTKGLRWQVTIPPVLPSLSVDPDRLGQVLGNLLSNAIKYTPVDGTVSVSADCTEDEVWIRVSDTGPGIALEDQERIFDPFYRGQRGRRFPQGMGLGLSIARELVVAHGGRLEVDSTPGLGSHFTLHLPLVSPDS